MSNKSVKKHYRRDKDSIKKLSSSINFFNNPAIKLLLKNTPTFQILTNDSILEIIANEKQADELINALTSKNLKIDDANKAILEAQKDKPINFFVLYSFITKFVNLRDGDIEKTLNRPEIEEALTKKIDLAIKDYKTSQGKAAARARLANDPIQKAKKEIEKHYEKHKTKFKRRGYTAQFVRDMHSQYPIITDSKTIANLVAKLKKSNKP